MAITRVRVKLPNPAGGGDAYNIWHVRTTDNYSEDPGPLEAAFTALEAFYNQVRAHMASGTITIGDSTIEDPLGAPTYVPIQPITLTSSQSSWAPSLLAVTCTWYTTSATRSGRGRTFIGPLATAAVQTDGTPAAATVGTIRTAADALVSDSLAANGWAIGVLSVKQGLLRDVTSSQVRDKFATMRSRRD